MDYTKWFAERLSQLRLEKGVSARDMSLSLGQSASYINKIENGRTMPSMNGLFYICEYLNIEPKDFFNYRNNAPAINAELVDSISRLPPNKAEHVRMIIEDLSE